MATKHRFLILEDVASHAELMQVELRRSKLLFTAKRVQTRDSFLTALREFQPDLILADYSLPTFDGMTALDFVLKQCPEVPFVFVSGAIGEERAIESVKKGATDYVLKHRLQRLGPSVLRALQEAEEKRARRRAEAALRKAHAELERKVEERTAALTMANNELKKEIAERKKVATALRESEQRLACILESAMDAIITVDAKQRIVLFNRAAEKVFLCSAAEIAAKPVEQFFSERFRDLLAKSASQRVATPYLWAPEGLTAIRSNGEEFPVEATLSHFKISGKKFCTIILRDINERLQAETELNKLQNQKSYLQEEIESVFNFGEIIGASQAMKSVFKQMEKVAHTDSTVLLTGATGTGKELVARAIHNLSKRNEAVWVSVNCGALPPGLVESELFGHEKGAFTGATARKKGRFELADEGTIFLDEVGELPLETQVKLLRVLQEQEFEPVGSARTIKVNVRVIAATNRNLEQAVTQGLFRSDLFYRLNIFPIYIPPLRERMEDVPLLANYFIRKFSDKMGKRIDSLDTASLDKLMGYDWPGNVRELANILERAVILCDKGNIRTDHIGISNKAVTRESRITTLEDMERMHIVKALEQTKGVVGGSEGAAKLLGINRSTLWSRMKKLGITKIDRVETFG